MDLSPGAVIAGRYRVDTKVGAGGMGEVWAGEHIGIGVRVAIKTLLPAAALNNEVVARFRREALLLGKIRSDHVARVVDFVQDDAYGLVLVMEFVEGDPLSRILQEKTLDVDETIELGVGIASALKDLHKANIIHRDLKPGNIIMAPLPDGRRRAVVVDFGVSRLMSDKSKDEDEELTGITRADMAVGTIEYMAPEQILNSRNVTPGSDIYAAGAILFRGAAGRHIFGNVASDAQLAQQKLTTESPPLPLQRSDKAAEGLARVVAKMLKRRPSERYKSADDVLADLFPVRDLARGAVAELENTTIDGAVGLAAAQGVAAAQGRAATPAADQPAAAPANGPQSAPSSTPSGADSSVSVSATHNPSRNEAPPRRGIPAVVTFGLVAAALGGGIFLGPQLMAPRAAPTMAADPPAATQPARTAAEVVTTVAPVATVLPSAAAGASAASASATPSTSASAGSSASAAPAMSATSAASTAPSAAKPAVVPGPLPRPAPAPLPRTAAPVVPLQPATPIKVEPTGI